MSGSLRQSRRKPSVRQSRSGQIVVEYVLILIISIGIAMMITSQLVSRNSESPGILTALWQEILVVIGQDPADDITR